MLNRERNGDESPRFGPIGRSTEEGTTSYEETHGLLYQKMTSRRGGY